MLNSSQQLNSLYRGLRPFFCIVYRQFAVRILAWGSGSGNIDRSFPSQSDWRHSPCTSCAGTEVDSVLILFWIERHKHRIFIGLHSSQLSCFLHSPLEPRVPQQEYKPGHLRVAHVMLVVFMTFSMTTHVSSRHGILFLATLTAWQNLTSLNVCFGVAWQFLVLHSLK
jgi:hypothetical protein